MDTIYYYFDQEFEDFVTAEDKLIVDIELWLITNIKLNKVPTYGGLNR